MNIAQSDAGRGELVGGSHPKREDKVRQLYPGSCLIFATIILYNLGYVSRETFNYNHGGKYEEEKKS